jgi:hypothetical protein
MLNVHLRITDAATNRPTPVRVRVTAPDGAHFPPLGWSAEFPTGRGEDVGGRVRFGRECWWYIDGGCEIPLPAGVPLRVQASKGPEFTPLDETVTLGAGQMALRFAVSRWADARAEGWHRIDTRCHFISPHAALLEARAEDLDVVNLLAAPHPLLAMDGNTYATTPNLLAFSGQAPAVERDGCAVAVNTFNAHPVLGKVALLHTHRPVFPLAFGGADADDWGVCDWCDQCRRKRGLTVWADAFEAAGGVTGGEALVAAVLGKIDAVEVTDGPREAPLLPWVYRLWDAGVRVALVGASGKDCNKVALGGVRTYVEVKNPPEGPSPAAATDPVPWPEAVRAGRTFVTAGPLLTVARDGARVRATARLRGGPAPVELVANGAVVASGSGSAEAVVPDPGWVAARCPPPGAFAHTSPLVLGAPARQPAAVAALRKLISQVGEWADAHGRYADPKRKAALLGRCAAAARALEPEGGP